MIKEEKISYERYKRVVKKGDFNNIKQAKIIPPSPFGSDKTRVKVKYKEPQKSKRDETKRVVYDPRRIKMDNPDLS